MDTAEYETNALVVNDISSIAYAYYESVSPTTDLLGREGPELEGALRNDGYLVYSDIARRGLWCFRILKKDTRPDTSGFARATAILDGTLALSEEATFEPASLLRNRGHVLPTINTPSSSSSNSSNPLDATFRSSQPITQGTMFESDAKTTAMGEARGATAITVKEAYENLVSALLFAISSAFCSKTGAMPLNSRTLLLPQQMQGERGLSVPILASIKVYMTTMGALIMVLSTSPVEGLVSLTDYALPPLSGITVLAAPLGLFATCQSIWDGEHSSNHSALAHSPDTQVSRVRPDKDIGHWQNICARLLRTKNLPSPLSGTQKWLNLQRVRRKPIEQSYDGKRTPMLGISSPTISWPSSLCFCKAFSKLSVTTGQLEPSPSNSEISYDPLTNAQTWFNNSSEREELLARKKQDRDALANHQVGANGQGPAGNGLSPVALHRPSNAGVALGAMYPTPPDGVQNMVGLTPSIEGTMSSPGHQANINAMPDIDATMTVPVEAYPNAWEYPEPKKEGTGPSFESENLFGDLGPDMFGDNDITDADFSFFDEQPGGMDMSLDPVGMPTADRLLDMAQEFHNATVSMAMPDPVDLPPPSAPPAPIFAKPELKHARSSIKDQPRRHTESDIDQQRVVPVKRQASPFNPDTVYKRIRASFDSHSQGSQKNKLHSPQPGSIFDRVDFGPGLSIVNRKYQGNGRFSFSLNRENQAEPFVFNAPPTTGYLQRHGKGRKLLKDPPANVGELFARMTSGVGLASQHASPARMADPPSDADEASLTSDQDDSSYESDEPLSPMKTSSVHRRRMDDDEQSLAASLRELDQEGASPRLSIDMPRFSRSDVDLPLSKYFAEAESSSVQVAISDQDFIIAAQLLTEQACTSTIGIACQQTTSLQSKLSRRRELLNATNLAMAELRSVLPDWMQASHECLFKPFLEVPDVPLLGQPTRMQPRPPGAEQLKPSNPFQIPSPRFEMRRYESKLSVLPSAVTFWESLGLGPSPGPKDINAVCIFPDFEGLSDNVSRFFDSMQGAYELLRLGTFSRMSASPDIPGGCLSYEVQRSSPSVASTNSILGDSLFNGLTRLCQVLSHLTVKETNFVIFFVYANGTSGSTVESCYAFQQLFERYKGLLRHNRKSIENDLVLQLIPMEFMASTNSLPTPSPSDYARLAVEVYDRCTLFGGAMPAPAIVLEQTIPRMIDFKLSTTPSSSLLHENTCLHIAYSQSLDERWITVAWTDNRGSQQMTASYCLGRKGKAICTPLSEIAHEIWETTRDMISTRKILWRIIITKCGVMDQAEIELWSSLAQAESRATVTLTLMTVDTDPSLQLLPPEVKVSSNASAGFYTTPVSTPQASTLSPEQSGNPPTPSLRDATSAPTPGGPGEAVGESDAEATLIEVTDQTWGAILAHRLNNSTSPAELAPAVVSGYLVKKSGSKVENPPAVMEVNIVHYEGNPRAYETLLREMITYFRGLGTLARARGIVDKETDVRPWHVAAAENGVRALTMLM